MMKFTLFLIVAILGLTSAQHVLKGECPKVQPTPNYSLEKFLGTWYDNQRYPASFVGSNKCGKAEFTLLPDNTVNVVYTSLSTITNSPVTLNAISTPIENGKFRVKFTKLLNAALPPLEFVVVGLNDDTTVVYACVGNPLLGVNLEFAWILSKKRVMAPALIASAKKELADHNLSPEYLVETNQFGCFDE